MVAVAMNEMYCSGAGMGGVTRIEVSKNVCKDNVETSTDRVTGRCDEGVDALREDSHFGVNHHFIGIHRPNSHTLQLIRLVLFPNVPKRV